MFILDYRTRAISGRQILLEGKVGIGPISDADFERQIARSENYSIADSKRSGIRHYLIDVAVATSDDERWARLGRALMRADSDGDLTPQVSDHFVRECPDSAFIVFANESANVRFVGWKRRVQRLLNNS